MTISQAESDYGWADEEMLEEMKEERRKKRDQELQSAMVPANNAQMSTVGLPSPDEYKMMTHMAKTLANSGLLPDHIKNAQSAFAVIQKGRELGVPPMAALSNIYVVKGRPACQAELLAALIERDYGSTALIVEDVNDKQCTVSFAKPGWTERKSFTFTIEMAKRAGLLTGANKHNWASYPEAMLRSRAISFVAKTHFQAAIGGMYLPDELEAQIVMNESGEITRIVEPPKDKAAKDDHDIQDGEFRDVTPHPEPADESASDNIDYDPFAEQEPAEEISPEAAFYQRIDAATSVQDLSKIVNDARKKFGKGSDVEQVAREKLDDLKAAETAGGGK